VGRVSVEWQENVGGWVMRVESAWPLSEQSYLHHRCGIPEQSIDQKADLPHKNYSMGE